MPNYLPKQAIKDAYAAVDYAQQVRSFHRRRTRRSSQQRSVDINVALERLKSAMKPLRSEIGRFSYGPQTEIAEENRQAIREASLAIQRERRKLWKLLPRNLDTPWIVEDGKLD